MFVIPTSSPFILTSAPPLLPGLIAASVWITFISQSSTLSSFKSTETVRSVAETIPWVTVPEYWIPNGEPIAKTVSPLSSKLESPKSITLTSKLGWHLKIATSLYSSLPTTSASTYSLFENTTCTLFAPSITWWFVII